LKYILFISQMFLGLLATGQLITGTVTNSNGEPLPFVSVSVLEDGIGTSTDYKGNYSLQLLNLNGEVSFSFVGYKTHIEIFDLGLESNKRIDVVLESSSISLDEAEVVSNTRDRAREIMKLARANRARHLDSLENFSLSIYQRISLTNELKRPSMKDTLELYRVEETDDGGRNPFLPELREIKEIQSKIYYQAPQKYKEFIYGINVYEEGEMPDEDDDVGRSASAGSTLEFGENVVVPQFQRADEPWILFEGADCFKINLYKTLISIDQVADKPILSPLAGTSAVAYKFDYKGTDFTSGEKQYIIQVTPLNSLENLFSGLIWLDAEDYSIRKLDLTLEGSLKLCNEIRLIYDFESKDSNYVPSGIYIEYSVRQGRRDDVVRVECAIDSVVMSPDLGSVKFNGEFKVIDKKAFDQGSEFWSVNRTIGLDSTTVKFVQKSDSIKAYYESPKYLHKLDSAFNKIDIWTPLIGLGHRNRVKGTEWYVEGLLGQVVPFGIGGYRHRLPGYFEKDVGDSYTYRISGHADYGFTNKDLKGKANLEFTYNPRKFLKTTISFGDYAN